MTKTDHLAKARDYIAIAESGDAKNAAYMSAAIEIRDASVSIREAQDFLGKNKEWVRRLLKWAEKFEWGGEDPSHPPFGGPEENEARYERADRRKVEDIISERPEIVAEAIAKAPAETQRKLADEIVKRPTESSLKSLATPREGKSRGGKSAEQRLGEATFTLWEVGEALMDQTPTAEERVRMTALAEKAERLAGAIRRSLDTGDFDAELRDLMAEVEA